MWLLQYTPSSPSAASASPAVPDVWLHEGDWPVGRHESNRICVPADKSISRKHAVLTVSFPSQQQQQRQLVLKVKDLGSSFGTWVNGEKLEPHVERTLRVGDSVKFGGVDTVFRCDVRRLRLCLTRLSGENKRAVQKLAARIGAEVVKEWTTPAPTHLVAPDITATTKMLVAICTQTPIVTPQWLVAILSRSKGTDPVPREAEFVPEAATAMEPLTTSRSSLFHHTDFIFPKEMHEYQTLITAAGGRLYLAVPEHSELDRYPWWNQVVLHMRDPQYKVFWFTENDRGAASATQSQTVTGLLEPFFASGQLAKITPSQIASTVFTCKSLHESGCEPMSLAPSTQATQATQATMASQAFETPITQPQPQPSRSTTTQARTRTLVDSQVLREEAVQAVQPPVTKPRVKQEAKASEPVPTVPEREKVKRRRDELEQAEEEDRKPAAVSAPPVTEQPTIRPTPAPQSKKAVAAAVITPPLPTRELAVAPSPKREAFPDIEHQHEQQQKKRAKKEPEESPERKQRPNYVAAEAPAVVDAPHPPRAQSSGTRDNPDDTDGMKARAAAPTAPTTTAVKSRPQQASPARRLTPPSSSWAVKPRDKSRQTPPIKAEKLASQNNAENVDPDEHSNEAEEEEEEFPRRPALTEDRDDLIVRPLLHRQISPADRHTGSGGGGSASNRRVVDFKRFTKNFVVGQHAAREDRVCIPRTQMTAVAPKESERQVQLRMQEEEAARNREDGDALFSTRLAAKAKKARRT